MPFEVKKYVNDVRFVFIHKRGISSFGDAEGHYFDIENSSLEYLQHENLENRAKRIEKVITFLKKQQWVDKKRLYLVGHSAGYRIAAEVAAKNKNLSKVVCMSANPFSRNVQYLREERLKMHRGELSDTLASAHIDTLMGNYLGLLAFEKQVLDKDKMLQKQWYSAQSEISYNKNFAIDNLLKINIPLLITYGSADIGALDNDLIPYFFIQKNKWNYDLKCYPDLEHNYLKKDKDGKIVEQHWQDVLDDVVKWLIL
jgi:pimeloyl-ACP methyl ester carboxylesterase